MRRVTARRRVPFRSVNRRCDPGYQPGMQRHHLLPLQLLGAQFFGLLFDRLGRERVGFDDFRRNGLLLPATERSAVRIGLPLHRGPHGGYNGMVAERVGQIEEDWSERRLRAPEVALEEALMRLTLLQGAAPSPARRNAPDAAQPIRPPRQGPGLRCARCAGGRTLARDRALAHPPETPLAALMIARTLAAATSSSMPTPQTVFRSGVVHSI